MGAITPVQSPALLVALAIFLTIISLGMLGLGFVLTGSGGERKSILLGFAVGIGGLAMSVYGFRLAAKRARWLRDQQAKAEQQH